MSTPIELPPLDMETGYYWEDKASSYIRCYQKDHPGMSTLEAAMALLDIGVLRQRERQLRESIARCRELEGAMKAQDERERLAGDRVGMPWVEYGCDWPDAVADRFLHLRAEIADARGIVEQFLTMVRGLLARTPVRNVPHLEDAAKSFLKRTAPPSERDAREGR